MSRHSTPTFGLGKLAIRDRETEMPVTTRARSGQASNLRPLQISASSAGASSSGMRSRRQRRATAGPSGTQSGRQPAGQQRAGAVPSASAPGDGGGDGSDNSDSSSDEEQAAPVRVQATPTQEQATPIQVAIYTALSAFNEDGLTPRSFADATGPGFTLATGLARNLAAGITELVQDNDDLRALQRWIPVPGTQWSATLARNMFRRFQAITASLQQNVRSNVNGQDVVQTVDQFRDLFMAIQTIGAKYFDGMERANREEFIAVLVVVLEYIVWNNDDLYRGTNRPAYAGNANRNERRLFSCFLAGESGPSEFTKVLAQFHRHLSHHAERLRAICQRVQGYAATGIEGGATRERLDWYANQLLNLCQLAQGAQPGA